MITKIYLSRLTGDFGEIHFYIKTIQWVDDKPRQDVLVSGNSAKLFKYISDTSFKNIFDADNNISLTMQELRAQIIEEYVDNRIKGIL